MLQKKLKKKNNLGIVKAKITTFIGVILER